jgi:diguanylate cyclase (GGDEF)-like protein
MSDDRTTNPNRTVATVVGQPRRAEVTNQACLVVIYGDELGRRVELANGRVAIGRSSSSELQLDQESVSRNHCEITARGGAYELRDLGSTNGTYVNDAPIDAVFLRDGDQIKVGRTILKFILGSNVEGQYHELIYKLMTTDGLTQVHNKRFFEEALEREVSRASRYKRPFALILFDIDHFKQVNDTHGHLAGDAVLRQLGSLVRARVRRDDIVARTGGEEFGVITPEIGAEGAVELAGKLLRLIEATSFEFDGTLIPVTVSLGVAGWDPAIHRAPDDLVKAADEKLYAAKRGGRNRVES